MQTRIAWVIDPRVDNVATVLGDGVEAGTVIPVQLGDRWAEITVMADIPYGHKIALRPIAKGELVYKYGLSIGRAVMEIGLGDHVHVHNIEPLRGRGDLAARGEGSNV